MIFCVELKQCFPYPKAYFNFGYRCDLPIMEFIKSNKGESKLCCEGYIYTKKRKLANGVISFQCVLRSNSQCKASVKVKNCQILERINDHTHAPDPSAVQRIIAIQKMKERALTTHESPQEIISRASELFGSEMAFNLPNIDNLKRKIRKCRERTRKPIPLPSTVEDLVIPEEFRLTKAGENFVLYDSGPSAERIVIFGTETNLSILESQTNWFVDGTFSVKPPLFSQVYTIHAAYNGKVIPCIYSLLPNKSEATYTSLLQRIQCLKPTLKPTSITVDFDKAMLSSIKTVFPETIIKGSFFHLCQCIYGKIQQSDLSSLFASSPDFSLRMRMISALAFCPPNCVCDAFEQLAARSTEVDHSIFGYFADEFIGRPGGKPAEFDISLWNMHARTLSDLPGINSAVEIWHRRFQSTVLCNRPDIWVFLKCLHKEQTLQEGLVNQNVHHPTIQKKQKDIASRIWEILGSFGDQSALEFLQNIAYSVNF